MGYDVHALSLPTSGCDVEFVAAVIAEWYRPEWCADEYESIL